MTTDTEKLSTDVQEREFVSSDSASDLLNRDPSKPYIDLAVAMDDAEIQRRSTWWYKTGVFFWDPLDKHPKERWFMFKLDWFLLSSSCCGYFLKYLNQKNVGTAYVNGMKEFYDMKGNDYNVMVTLWTVGYIVGQIPSNLILHRISARYYLFGLELAWGILTILSVTPKSIHGLYAIRFLVGLFESGYFPGLEYLIGSWYSKEELSKRSAYFNCAGTAAGLVSGPLQESILNASWAQKGLQPFQWMFVIDFVISVPIAFYTLFVDPNTPSTTNAFYFSEDDKLIALERRRRIGAQLNTREPYTWPKIKSFFNTWHVWLFPPLFLCFNNGDQVTTSQTFSLWIKNGLHMGSYYYNNYPTIISGAGIALSLFTAYMNDFFGGGYNPYILFTMFLLLTFGNALNAAWDIPIGLHWAAYFLQAVPHAVGQSMIFSWLNGMLHFDDMKRNFVVVVTNVLPYITAAWVPVLTFNQDDGPEFRKGFIYTACLQFVGAIFTVIVFLFARRDEKRAKRAEAEEKAEQLDVIA